MRVTQPFDASTWLSIDPERRRRVDFTQGHESFDLAQDRELVERLVEWQMDGFRQPQRQGCLAIYYRGIKGMKRLIIGLLFLLGFFLGSAHAGEIKEFELKDGSVIYGEIVSFSGGTFTVRSTSFGTVEIDESKIRAIRSGIPMERKRDQIQQLQQRMMSDEEVVQMILSLQNDPDVQKILQDPEIMKAVNSGDINALLANPKFMKLLENPTIQDIRKKVTE